MARPLQLHANTEIIAEMPGVGIFVAQGDTVPSDGAAGYATGCIYVHRDGGAGTAIYVNEGTKTSANFDAVAAVDGTLLDATAGTVTASKAIIVDSNKAITGMGGITFDDAVNIAVNTTTGTKIGTAVGQKIGFWNATPVVQQASASQAALTNSTGGTTDGTLSAVGATNGSDVSGTINNNFAELHVLLNAIRTALVNTGIIKGAA